MQVVSPVLKDISASVASLVAELSRNVSFLGFTLIQVETAGS